MDGIDINDILRLRNLVTELDWFRSRSADSNAYSEIAGFLALHAGEEAETETAKVQAEISRLIL